MKLAFLKTFQQARYHQLGPKHLTKHLLSGSQSLMTKKSFSLKL
jgi:hypothetical protein